MYASRYALSHDASTTLFPCALQVQSRRKSIFILHLFPGRHHVHSRFLSRESIFPFHSAFQRARCARRGSRYRPGRRSLERFYHCDTCEEGSIARCCQGNRSSNHVLIFTVVFARCRSYEARSDGAEDASTRQPCDPRIRSPNSSANGSSRKSTYTYISPASIATVSIRLHHASSRFSSLAPLQLSPRSS